MEIENPDRIREDSVETVNSYKYKETEDFEAFKLKVKKRVNLLSPPSIVILELFIRLDENGIGLIKTEDFIRSLSHYGFPLHKFKRFTESTFIDPDSHGIVKFQELLEKLEHFEKNINTEDMDLIINSLNELDKKILAENDELD